MVSILPKVTDCALSSNGLIRAREDMKAELESQATSQTASLSRQSAIGVV